MDSYLHLDLLGDELKNMHHQLTKECDTLVSTLISFDKVYDEDYLEAKVYQLAIVKEEVQRLELEHESITASNSERRFEIYDKIELFNSKLCSLTEEINALQCERNNKHQIWKENYMQKAEKLAELDSLLKSIEQVQYVLDLTKKKKLKLSKNVMSLCSLHSDVNNILRAKSIKKEKTPHKAIISAYNHGLISQEAYKLCIV